MTAPRSALHIGRADLIVVNGARFYGPRSTSPDPALLAEIRTLLARIAERLR